MRAARKVPRSTGAAVSGSTDEPPAAPRPNRLALRLLRCRQLRVIWKHGALASAVSQTLSEQRRNRPRRAKGKWLNVESRTTGPRRAAAATPVTAPATVAQPRGTDQRGSGTWLQPLWIERGRPIEAAASNPDSVRELSRL